MTGPARFHKKPVVIEAVRWTGDNYWDVVAPFLHGQDHFVSRADKVAIKTLEGTMDADVGDWIIKGVQGEFYPCKPDIFEATYEPAEEAS
jgi:hypothetical protein